MKTFGRVVSGICGAGVVLGVAACGGAGSTQTPLTVTQALAEANIPCTDQQSEQVRGLADGAPNLDFLRCSATGGDYGFVLWDDSNDRQKIIDATCTQLLPVDGVAEEVYANDIGLAGKVTVGANWVAVTETGSIVRAEDLASTLSGEVNSFSELCGTYAEEVLAAMAEADAKLAAEQAAQQREADMRALAADQSRQAKDPNSTPDDLRALVRTQDYQVAVDLALNPNTPSDVLESLFKRKFEVQFGNPATLGWAIAKNPNTPLPLLEELAGSADAPTKAQAQQALASRTATS